MANSNLPPPNSRSEFEIAIICALTIEYDAVALLIDQFWDEDGDTYGRAIGDPNTYTTGRMGSFDIVLVLLPEIGKISAASAASSFRSSFPNITLALLVGTCGGVPYTRDNEEILLGDVIISKTVIQYDLGKQYSEEFLTKETLEDRLGRPGRNIRSILAVMETNHRRDRLENRAAELLEKLQRHASQKKTQKPVKYEYPGVLKDRLFEPNYLHKHQILLPHRCCEEAPCHRSHKLSCADLGCEDEHLVQRQRINDQAQHLSIFVGRFGSGDTILKSGMYRDEIAQRHGLLAFEMEGAGIWDELPCIIIKGVSNYADGHWNAGLSWQQFAAATAAAAARALIERYPKTDKPHPPLVVIEERRKRTKEEDECLKDMHITDPSFDKKRIEDTNGGLLRDSYVWILTNADFVQWRDTPDGGLLWIKGDPGKGKTMLLCGLIDEIQADQAIQPYYFFCQASDSRLNSATKVLCSLVYSIACQDQLALSYVMEKYIHAGKELFHNTNSWTALSQILTHILQNINLKNKIFIIDGLDECVADLPLLLEFIAQASGLFEIKWIVSSRHRADIEEKLNTSSKKLFLSLELNEQSISDAVHVYIKHKVDQLATLKKLDDSSRGAIEAHLFNNANGTFLWVALVYKELFKGGVKKRHLQDLMTAFPPELEPLYARMMEQVCESRDKKICLQLLEFISLTYRPILLIELAPLLEILEDSDGFDELIDIIATCGSFLVLKDDVVYFIHQSAKDFLLNKTSNQIFTSGISPTHYNIFSRSLQILSQTLRRDIYSLRHPGALKSEACVPNPDLLAPLRYACLFWVDHLRDAGSSFSGKNISEPSLQDERDIHSFLKVHFLHWSEAFCLMGNLSVGIMAIRTLESLTTQGMDPLRMFVRDALRFVLSFRQAIEYTPLQLYYSALLFAPTSSIIRKTFEPIHLTWALQKPSVRSQWDACLQILEGHQKEVLSVKFSPDNMRLASSSRDSTVRIWDRATGACLQTIASDLFGEKSISHVEFSPHSSQFLLTRGTFIEILNLNTGKCLEMLGYGRIHHYTPSVTYSSNGAELIISSPCWEDEEFHIWDLTKGMRLQKEDYYREVREPAVFLLDAPEQSRFANIVRSPITGSCVQIFTTGCADRIVFSSDGKQFAIMMEDEHYPVFILDAATGKCLLNFKTRNRASSVAFSPDGTRLAIGFWSACSVQIWDIAAGACLCTFSGHLDNIRSVAFSVDGTEIASSSDDNTVRIWDLALGASAHLEESDYRMPSLTYSLDNVRLARQSGSHIEGLHHRITSITYSSDNTRLALIKVATRIRRHSTIEIWDSTTGICLHQLQLDRRTTMVAFSPDNTQLAMAQYLKNDEVEIWDLATNTRQRKFEANLIAEIKALTFSPDGTRLAQLYWYSETSTINIWDMINNVTIYTFQSLRQMIGVHFSPDGRRLGCISEDGMALMWDLVTSECLQILEFDTKKTSSRVRMKTNLEQLGNLKTNHLETLGSLRRDQSQCLIDKMLQNQDSIHSAVLEFDFNSDKTWLLRRGEPFLWFPPECRPDTMSFYGEHIAIVAPKQNVLLFRFRLAELDAIMASNRSSLLEV